MTDRKQAETFPGKAGKRRTGRLAGNFKPSLLFSSLLLTACTGNGGAANSWGEVYNPDGTPVSSGSGGGSSSSGSSGSSASGSSGSTAASGTSSTSGTGSQTISAGDLLNYTNSGMADSISKLFPTGEDETAKTFFMNLSAEDFGVPEDGYMVLSLDSDGFAGRTGSHWDDTQYVSGDGMINFTDIPMMRVGSNVTVVVLCYAADGTLISSGYSSGEAKENGVPMEISILGSARIVLGSNSAPNGSTSEHDGVSYDVIEYTGTGLEMAAVNTTAGSTMEVKVNGTVVSTTTDQSFTTALADGYNAIEVTVTKGDNTPIVAKRNIYVVRQFSTPVIALGSNGTANGKTATGSDGRTYDVIEYTGSSLGVTVTNGFEGTATFDVQVNGSSVSGTPVTGGATSVNQTLADGFNAIVATLTESVNGSVQAERYVYVVKKLVKPVITQDGGTPNGKTASSGGKSYTVIEYEGTSPTVNVTNSYDGDGAGTTASVFTVTHNGSTASASMTLSDGFNAIVATLEKEHCVTQRDEKYYYVVKKLVVPVITMSGGTANGETVTSGGKSYTVIEYESTLPTVTITNSYNGSSASYEAKLGTTVLSTACPSTITNHTLSDGFNAVTATLSEPYCDTLKDEKYYYVVKKLSEDDISITFDDYLSPAVDGEYEVLHYSYLADTITLPNVSVSNTYTGDAATPELGNSYLEITVTGDTTVAQTASLSGQELNLGDCTVTVNLCKSKCTSASVEKKVRIKIKPVTVSMSSITLDYDDIEQTKWVAQQAYMQASTDSDSTPVYSMNGEEHNAAFTKNVDASVVLTAPDSTFRFWTTDGFCTYDHPGVGHTPFGHYDNTWTLDELKVPANRSVNQYVGSSQRASRYIFTLTVSDD